MNKYQKAFDFINSDNVTAWGKENYEPFLEAKEMFEELKLRPKEAPFDGWLVYGDKAHPLGVQVIFDLNNKSVTANTNVSVKLYKAIGKQMEELGWLEE